MCGWQVSSPPRHPARRATQTPAPSVSSSYFGAAYKAYKHTGRHVLVTQRCFLDHFALNQNQTYRLQHQSVALPELFFGQCCYFKAGRYSTYCPCVADARGNQQNTPNLPQVAALTFFPPVSHTTNMAKVTNHYILAHRPPQFAQKASVLLASTRSIVPYFST